MFKRFFFADESIKKEVFNAAAELCWRHKLEEVPQLIEQTLLIFKLVAEALEMGLDDLLVTG
ncbi:MAG: hypothetical protein ABJJ43_09865 [Ekhidna sp.]